MREELLKEPLLGTSAAIRRTAAPPITIRWSTTTPDYRRAATTAAATATKQSGFRAIGIGKANETDSDDRR